MVELAPRLSEAEHTQQKPWLPLHTPATCWLVELDTSYGARADVKTTDALADLKTDRYARSVLAMLPCCLLDENPNVPLRVLVILACPCCLPDENPLTPQKDAHDRIARQLAAEGHLRDVLLDPGAVSRLRPATGGRGIVIPVLARPTRR